MGFGIHVSPPGYTAVCIASVFVAESYRCRDEEERHMEPESDNGAGDGDQDGSSSSDSSSEWLTDSLVAVERYPDGQEEASVEARPGRNDLDETRPGMVSMEENHHDFHTVDDASDEIDNGEGDESDVGGIFNS